MTARHKLNHANFIGIAIIAAAVAAVFESWAAFWIAAVVLAVAAVHSGNIRLDSARHQRR